MPTIKDRPTMERFAGALTRAFGGASRAGRTGPTAKDEAGLSNDAYSQGRGRDGPAAQGGRGEPQRLPGQKGTPSGLAAKTRALFGRSGSPTAATGKSRAQAFSAAARAQAPAPRDASPSSVGSRQEQPFTEAMFEKGGTLEAFAHLRGYLPEGSVTPSPTASRTSSPAQSPSNSPVLGPQTGRPTRSGSSRTSLPRTPEGLAQSNADGHAELSDADQELWSKL